MKLSAGPVVGLILLATLVEAPAAYNVLDHWTKRATNAVNRVRFVGGQFVAVGNNGLIMTSSNGANWTVRNSGTSQTLRSVTHGTPGFGADYFIVVGNNNTILLSPDAVTWTNLNFTSSTMDIVDVAVSGSVFIGVGTSGSANIVRFQYLFPSWTWSTQRITNAPGQCDAGQFAVFRSVVRASNTWVAVGDICTGIWTAPSGGTPWTYRPGTNSAYQQYRLGVAYGNNVAVSIGQEGPPHVATSPFTSWTPYLVNTNGGQIDPYNYFVGYDITFGDGRFVVPHNSEMLETTNGQDWVIHGGTGFPTSIAYGAGCFVKNGGGIHQSDNIAGLLAARRTSVDGPVELSLTIEPQRTFGIQATTNFAQWTEIIRGTNTSGGTPQFLDWSVTNGISRYYRTVTP